MMITVIAQADHLSSDILQIRPDPTLSAPKARLSQHNESEYNCRRIFQSIGQICAFWLGHVFWHHQNRANSSSTLTMGFFWQFSHGTVARYLCAPLAQSQAAHSILDHALPQVPRSAFVRSVQLDALNLVVTPA